MFHVYPLFSCLHGKAGNKEKKNVITSQVVLAEMCKMERATL